MHKVAILTHTGMSLFGYAIAHELFGSRRTEAPQVSYETWPYAADGSLAMQMAGIDVSIPPPRRLCDADTIIIPSWSRRQGIATGRTMRLLCEAHDRGVRLISFCSGSFLLAEAGLLDGRMACTHWRYADAFKARFPKVTLQEDRLFVASGDNIYTSAGSAAGIDLGLHIIRADFGARAARAVAHGLVAWQARDGDAPQRHVQPVPERAQDIRIARLVHGLPARLGEPLTVDQLAKEAGMSRRSFLRWFKAATGETPAAHLAALKTRRACELLEAGNCSVEEVSSLCGYESAGAFREMFRRSTGMCPTAWRRSRQGAGVSLRAAG